MKQRDDYVDVKEAVLNSASSGAIVGTAIDTTGYGRARFIFILGGTAGTGSMSGNVGIWECATSDGTYTSNSTAILTARTSGIISSGIVGIIDVATDPTYPWLKVSGDFSLATVYHGAVCELYHGVNVQAGTSVTEIVQVN